MSEALLGKTDANRFNQLRRHLFVSNEGKRMMDLAETVWLFDVLPPNGEVSSDGYGCIFTAEERLVRSLV